MMKRLLNLINKSNLILVLILGTLFAGQGLVSGSVALADSSVSPIAGQGCKVTNMQGDPLSSHSFDYSCPSGVTYHCNDEVAADRSSTTVCNGSNGSSFTQTCPANAVQSNSSGGYTINCTYSTSGTTSTPSTTTGSTQSNVSPKSNPIWLHYILLILGNVVFLGIIIVIVVYALHWRVRRMARTAGLPPAPVPSQSVPQAPTGVQAANVPGRKFCSNCGQQLADGAKFCSSCGQAADQ